MDDGRARLVELTELQARGCRMMGSPLYAALLQAAAADVAAGGPVWRVLRERVDDPEDSALALRLLAAVHRLVLAGRSPELAAYYPSTGGSGALDDDGDGVAEAFLRTVEAHQENVREHVRRPLQTNEVGRSAALVGGFLTVADRYGLPLNVLEVGASAGLNLRWDHYLYEARGQTWGEPGSPVRLCSFDTDVAPPFHVETSVSSRRGCDPNPIDPTTEEGALTLLSFVWPDQVTRIRLLRAAIDVAGRVPARVDRATASEWTTRHVRGLPDGVATVVFHSIVLQYMDDEQRHAFAETVSSAGAAATRGSPVAYLRMEAAEDLKDVEIRLTTWPGGEDRLLARSGYHGTSVRWLGTPS